jgi:hypothetical protein
MAITKDDETGRLPIAINDRERRLAEVVIKHELGRGGGSAPQYANGTTSADVLG